jgi:16S rRNA (cytidine1402-2'-O)-methyltransferase
MEHAAAHERADAKQGSVLYVVATPIGNLRDISLRALDVLGRVDAVAAEDTRVTRQLLSHYGIRKRMIAVHAHNERRAAGQVLALLASGQSIAFACDAGTPGISDPGAFLAAAAREAGYAVVPVPGANAALAALAAGGLEAPHFLFFGFLPPRGGERRRALAGIAGLPYVLVFFEAPHRIVESVSDLETVLGGARRIVIARELTKLHESLHLCRLAEARAWLTGDADRRRGEFVLLVEGASAAAQEEPERGRQALGILLAELPLKQAVDLAVKLSGARRNDLYSLALQLKSRRDS